MKEMNPVLRFARVYRRPIKRVSGLNMEDCAPERGVNLGLSLGSWRLTIRADTVEAEGVIGQFKISEFGDFVLKFLDSFILELFDFATIHTDQMVVVIFISVVIMTFIVQVV